MKISVSTTELNEEGTWKITDADIHDMANWFSPGRELDIFRATEYVEYRERWEFNRSRNICMGFIFGFALALVAVGIMVGVF